MTDWVLSLGSNVSAGLAAAALAPQCSSILEWDAFLGPAARRVAFAWMLALPNVVKRIDGLRPHRRDAGHPVDRVVAGSRASLW